MSTHWKFTNSFVLLLAGTFACGCPQTMDEGQLGGNDLQDLIGGRNVADNNGDGGQINNGDATGDDILDTGDDTPVGDEPIDVDGIGSLGDSGAARIFYTDLISGPSRGGFHDAGTIVTLYGNGFGDQRGDATVTIGAGGAADYLAWSNTRIAVQIGNDATSGGIVVHTAVGDSNPAPFSVRPGGRILFVAADGSDANGGGYDDPLASLPLAVELVGPGDIIYAMDGVVADAEHLNEAALSLEAEGTADEPIALVAFPGAAVTIGDPDGLHYGVRVAPPVGVSTSYWVLAGLRLRGRVSALDIGGDGAVGWRVIGNDISCPDGDGPTGCFVASTVTHMHFLGNEVHDTGVVAGTKQYHAVYFTTDSNHVEVGWNHVHDNNTCRAIQFHSSPLCLPDCGASDTTGFNQYDLIIHDNVIHGDACDGIVLATVDPSQGPVDVFNNVIYDVGRGPDPSDGGANYAGIFLPGYVNNGPEGTGVVEVYNNTLYDCGARGGQAAGALARGEYSPDLILRLRNNIIYQPAGQPYFSEETHTEWITGENNLWYGAGTGPAFLTGNVDADPRFVDLSSFDFRLANDSQALNAGADTGLDWDIVGARRPAHAAVDLGAFEH